MEPKELAALLGKEINAGFAAALSQPGSVLKVSRIIARLGTTDKDWQAEVILHPADEDATVSPTAAEAIAVLPVIALQGVGPSWQNIFARHRITNIGHLAEADPDEVRAWGGIKGLSLAGRARSAIVSGEWSFAAEGISVLEVVRRSANSHKEHERRAYALTLLGYLDVAYLSQLKFAL